jgi:ferredoxin
MSGKALRGHRVTVDKALCIGSGNCAAEAPDVFEFGDDGLAEVTGAADTHPVESLDAIADSCPALAIRVLHGSEPA